jgi:tripartite-type tricarboxylate transporter receptor subunit TctC
VRICQESDQVITYRSPQDLARYIAETHKTWGALITSLGFKED